MTSTEPASTSRPPGTITDRYAVIGHPVAHSRSPQIQAHFAQAHAQAMDYGRIEATAEQFDVKAREFFDSGGKGLNVTLPHKEAAARLADALTERARLAGAVNVLAKRPDGSLLGDNTDGAGLVADLARLGVQVTDRRVLLVGAGGATRGILAPLLALQPAVLVVDNRTPARAEALVAEFKALLPGELGERLSAKRVGGNAFDLVINATSSGHARVVPQLGDKVIGTKTFAYDLSYGDAAVPFLQFARQHGAAGTADGLGMLIEQAAESFLVWRGLRPLTEALHASLHASLQNGLQASSSEPVVLNKP